MTPSERLYKEILSYFTKHNNDMSQKVWIGVFTELMSMGYTKSQISRALETLDEKNGNLGYLMLTYTPDSQGNGTASVSGHTGWVSIKGQDYLYNLENPKNEQSTTQFIFNSPVTTQGQTSFGNQQNRGNINVFDQNVPELMSKLRGLSGNFVTSDDQNNFQEFVQQIQSILDSDEVPQSGKLSKFKSFLNKSWNILSPVVNPLLAEIAKRMLLP